MARFRTLEEITLSMLDSLRLSQPEADSKPGSVIRDLMVDLPAAEIAKVYVDLRNTQTFQSISLATGQDLDRYARNFGITRNSGSPAFGVVVFTTNTLDAAIVVPTGTVVIARNGSTFSTVSDILFDSTKKSLYRSNAIRLQVDLELAGIVDQFAIEVGVQATTAGAAGRIGKYQLISQPISGVSNVTNTEAFNGGTSIETDDQFRARILSVFAGSNIGTALGYLNAVKTDPRVADALVIGPGDPLMTRDGSQIGEDADGNPVVIQSGTGGKVDLIVLGSDFRTISESFIFRDRSGRNDPTDPVNDYILGGRGINPELDYAQKRRLYFQQGVLPYQPIGQILSLSGSLSGPNFIESFVENGQVKGIFELVKDDGVFGGSSFGFDRIRFIASEIDLEDEQLTKTQFNSQDPLDYTNTQHIVAANQTINLLREVAVVDPIDRSLLTVRHTPVISADRVFNQTTGERYRIVSQNPDGVAGQPNTTGRIKIFGGTLPAVNDIVEVNYAWDCEYDRYLDFDNLETVSVVRTAQDSIDWGFANRVVAEETEVVYSAEDGYHIIVTHPVSRVVDVNTAIKETVLASSGQLIVANIVVSISSIVDSAGREVYYTALSDGSFSGSEITLPTDSILPASATATITYNSEDIYSPDGIDEGSFVNNIIKLNSFTGLGDTVYVNYVANVPTLLPNTALSVLPVVGTENEFAVDGDLVGSQPISNLYMNDGTIIKNIRFSPTFLRLNFSGVVASGRLQIRGSAFKKVVAVFTNLRDGLTIDLTTALQAEFGSIATGTYVAKLEKLERVTLSDGDVTAVEFDYDILNYSIKTPTYSNQTGFADSSLTSVQFSLQSTSANLAEAPITGSSLRVTFYVVVPETERLVISTTGLQITKFKYVFVDRIAIESGFVGLSGSVSGNVIITPMTQPQAGTQYKVDYSYTAPKEGERITVNYTYNKLVSDLIGTLEPVRPITADVLVRSAESVGIDVSVIVTPNANFAGSVTNLTQEVNERLTTFINGLGLGAVIDYSDLITASYAVSGVDRVVMRTLNLAGQTGVQKSLVADRDQYFSVNTLTITVVER